MHKSFLDYLGSIWLLKLNLFSKVSYPTVGRYLRVAPLNFCHPDFLLPNVCMIGGPIGPLRTHSAAALLHLLPHCCACCLSPMLAPCHIPVTNIMSLLNAVFVFQTFLKSIANDSVSPTRSVIECRVEAILHSFL